MTTTEAPVRHTMRTLYPKEGDLKLDWDPKDPESVRRAEVGFAKAIAKRFQAFRLDPKDRREGEPIKKFDPSYERILLVPPVVGG